jgi:hypothetical protein
MRTILFDYIEVFCSQSQALGARAERASVGSEEEPGDGR